METPPRFFRDFTWVNRGLLVVLGLLLGIPVSEKLAYRGWQRQYWRVGLCSRPADVLTLLSGDLVMDNQTGLPLDPNELDPYRNPLCPSCEDYYWLDSKEKAFLLPPTTLRLEWASLVERRFYRGEFLLPKARIDSLFARYKAMPAPSQLSLGLTLVVKLAARGRVSLGVLVPTPDKQGEDSTSIRELASFQATPYQPDWHEKATYERFYQAKTPQAYLDTLVSRIDSAGRFDVPHWHP